MRDKLAHDSKLEGRDTTTALPDGNCSRLFRARTSRADVQSLGSMSEDEGSAARRLPMYPYFLTLHRFDQSFCKPASHLS